LLGIFAVASAITGCQSHERLTTAPSHLPTLPSLPSATSVAGTVKEGPIDPPHGLPGVECGENTRGFRARYLPVEIGIACADNGIRATRLTWEGWTAKRALARGVYVQNDCKPSCLGGHLVEYPGARFELLGPLYGNNFSAIVVTFVPGRSGPDGQRRLTHSL
jgi:hypothetical protein